MPHVTLARLRERPDEAAPVARYVAAHTGFAAPAFRAGHMTLYASHLHRDGADYEPLAHYPLLPG